MDGPYDRTLCIMWRNIVKDSGEDPDSINMCTTYESEQMESVITYMMCFNETRHMSPKVELGIIPFNECEE